jgi:hypothetical protein
MHYFHRALLAALLLWAGLAAQAKVRLPHLIGENMILQQDRCPPVGLGTTRADRHGVYLVEYQ